MSRENARLNRQEGFQNLHAEWEAGQGIVHNPDEELILIPRGALQIILNAVELWCEAETFFEVSGVEEARQRLQHLSES